MAAMESLCCLVGINLSRFSQEEITLLEAQIFLHIYAELREYFRRQYKNYFSLMKWSIEKENSMLDNRFLGLIIQDILSTDEYSIKGIAYYTGTHEDVIQDVIAGRNINPSAALFRKSIDLHQRVRRDLYGSIMKKMVS